VPLFRRAKPLHQRLAEEGGLGTGLEGTGLDDRGPAPAAQLPGWDGEPRGEPGVHGVPRAKRWDAVETVDAPELKGDEVKLVALSDGTILCEEDERDAALRPLVEAVGTRVDTPFRAEAVRRGGPRWAVAASRIATLTLPGLRGDRAELVSTREQTVLTVDGRPTTRRVEDLERLGVAHGAEYVVRATRLNGDLWEVEANAL
jgi:hypothetical protein